MKLRRARAACAQARGRPSRRPQARPSMPPRSVKEARGVPARSRPRSLLIDEDKSLALGIVRATSAELRAQGSTRSRVGRAASYSQPRNGQSFSHHSPAQMSMTSLPSKTIARRRADQRAPSGSRLRGHDRTTGREALHSSLSRNIVILLDLVLPDLDGFAVIDHCERRTARYCHASSS